MMLTRTPEHVLKKEGARSVEWSWAQRLFLSLSLVVILGIVIAAPGGLLDRADRVGYAVCHQIIARTYVFGDRPLPLCARCSGQYLAALGGLLWLIAAGRGRAGRLPHWPITATLLVFLAVWGIDSLNSYLTLFPGLSYLYEPSNLLRVSAGTLEGMALAGLFTPFFNLTIWHQPTDQPTLRGWHELLGWTAMSALIVLAVQSEWVPLLYPIAIFSVLGVLTLLTMVNSMIVAVVLQRDGTAETWLEAAMVLVPGLALALIEILALNLARSAVSGWLRLPF